MKKTRNPIAKDLRSPKYRKRIVLSKKVYSRKAKHPKKGNGQSQYNYKEI